MIAKILSMNLDGMSITNIAGQLNRDGVHLLSGEGRWKKKDVYKIIKSNRNRLSGERTR